MEVELKLNGSDRRLRGTLLVAVGLWVLVSIGVLGAAHTVEADGEPLLLTPARYSLYRYRNRVAGWCRDLDRVDALVAEVLAQEEPDPLVHGPALRSAWSLLADVEREAQAAPMDALILRDGILAAVEAYRDALTAAGVYVNRPTRRDRMDLRQALEMAQEVEGCTAK